VVESSGNATLEQWAQTAMTESAPFDSLPQQFTGDSLELRYRFHFRPLPHPVSRAHGFEGQFGAGGNIGDIQTLSSGAPLGPRPGEPIEGKTYRGQPVYKTGGGIAPPKPLYNPDPEYTERARKKKLQGTVVLEMVVTPEGDVDDVKVVRETEPEFEQKALEAVRQWKFHPATKDGSPVAVQIDAEVAFRLY